MAKSADSKHRPRVRKSAPTVRERVEAANTVTEKKKPVRNTLARVSSPVKKLRLSDRRTLKIAAVPFRFLKRMLNWLVPRYFVNSWRELRLVIWPNRRETWRLTLAVFIFAVIFGAMVAGVDKGLDDLFKKVILK